MSPPLKILHVCKTYYPDTYGGVEQVVRTLCEYTLLHGLQATVCTVSPNVKDASCRDEGGYSVWRFPADFTLASSPFSWAVWQKFSELADQHDLIHCHFPWPFADVLALLRGLGKPLLITYQSDVIKQRWLGKLYLPLQRHFLKRADCIVASSDNYRKTSLVLRRFPQKTKVIPLGLDFPAWCWGPERDIPDWRMRFGSRYFVFIGSFRYYKGLDVLLQAMQQVDTPLVLIGDGTERALYEMMAHQFAPGRVHFVGALDDRTKFSILSGAYAFVFPSNIRSEAYGLGLVEAAMMGKAMISCEMGTGTSFVNQHEKTGLVVPPNDAVALAAAMQDLLNNPTMVAEMGLVARQWYAAELTGSKMASAYAELYRQLVPSSSQTFKIQG